MRIVLTGATGRIGAYLRDPLIMRGWNVVAWGGSSGGAWNGEDVVGVDLTDRGAILRRLDQDAPDVVLHVAAISDAEAVRRDPDRGRCINVDAVGTIAEWCETHDRRLVFTSTDMVFDGSQSWWNENDEPAPILAYGATKREAERQALRASNAAVARIGLLYGPTRCGRETFYDKAVARLRLGESQTFFDDEYRTPLDYSTAAEILARLVESPYAGQLHVGGISRLSRYELMRGAARGLGLDESLVRSNSRRDAVFAEPRPADLSMETGRLASLFPDLERRAVDEAVRAMEDSSG